MKDVAKFSLFQGGIKNTTPNKELTIKDFIKILTDNKLSNTIDLISKSNGEEKKKLKNSLDYVTFNGVFSKRANNSLVKLSNLFCLDFDGLEDANKIKEQLKKDQYIHLMFISPSKKGLKIIFKTPKETTQKDITLRIITAYDYILNKYDLKGDVATHDLSRACFVSYDKDYYYNSDCDIFKEIKAIEKKEIPTSLPTLETLENNLIPYKDTFFSTILNKNDLWNEIFNMLNNHDLNNEGEGSNQIFNKNLSIFISKNKEYLNKSSSFIHSWSNPYVTSERFQYYYDKVNNKILSKQQNQEAYHNEVNYNELLKWAKEYNLKLFIELLNLQLNKTKTFDFSRTTLKELTDMKDTRKAYIKDMFMSESLNMIFSPPKTMKSFFSIYTACCIATGTPMLNQKTKEAKVLYIDFENGKYTLKERFEGFIKGEKFNSKKLDENLHLMSFPTTFFEERNRELIIKPEAKETIFNYIKEHNIEVVYIDTLRRLGNFDENDSRAINSIYSNLFSPLLKEFSCCVIFLHHTPKDNGKQYRGSGDILGMITTAYSISKNDKKNLLTVSKYESRDNPLESLQIFYEIENRIDIDNDGDEKEVIDYVKFTRTEETDLPEVENFSLGRNILIDNLVLEQQYRNKEITELLSSHLDVKPRTIQEIIKFAYKKNIIFDNNETAQRRRYYLNPELKNKITDVSSSEVSTTETQTKNVINEFLHNKFKTQDQIELSLLKKTNDEFNKGLFEEKHLSLVIENWNKKGWINLAKKGYLSVTELYRGENN